MLGKDNGNERGLHARTRQLCADSKVTVSSKYHVLRVSERTSNASEKTLKMGKLLLGHKRKQIFDNSFLIRGIRATHYARE